MRDKLIEILKDRDNIPITTILEMIPESKGEFAMFMPMQKGCNENVFIAAKVSQDFIHLWNEFEQNKYLAWMPCGIMEYLFENANIYRSKIATVAMVKRGKKECWMPVLISKGVNFKSILK